MMAMIDDQNALIKCVVLETWVVIVTWPYLNVSNSIYNCHGLDLTHVDGWCCNDHMCQMGSVL